MKQGDSSSKSQVLYWRIIGISLGDLQGAGAPFMSLCKVLGFRYDLLIQAWDLMSMTFRDNKWYLLLPAGLQCW